MSLQRDQIYDHIHHVPLNYADPNLSYNIKPDASSQLSTRDHHEAALLPDCVLQPLQANFLAM
jgi:hypothetical protein